MVRHDYETDYIKLHWQIEALKGQIRELERERNRNGNFLWMIRHAFINALQGMGIDDGALEKKSDSDLLVMFEHQMRNDWRFSRCPNAEELKCRPLAIQTTPDNDLIYCSDCGWDIRDHPPQIEIKDPPPDKAITDKKIKRKKL